MTIDKFLDTWTRKKHTIIFCDYKYYDDMFDLIDEISENKNDIEMVFPYAYGAIIGGFGDFRETILLNETIINAEVEEFFIHKDTVIIWLEPKENIKDKNSYEDHCVCCLYNDKSCCEEPCATCMYNFVDKWKPK